MSADEYRQQDGQVLFAPGDGLDPHPQWRWDQRIGDSEWTVRAAWRDGKPIDWPGESYARIHEETNTLLIAEWGCIQTVVDAGDLGRETTRDIIRDYKEGMLDE